MFSQNNGKVQHQDKTLGDMREPQQHLMPPGESPEADPPLVPHKNHSE